MKNITKKECEKVMGKVKVMITNNQTEVKIPVGIRLLVRRCCHAVLEYEGHNDDFEVSVSFVNDEQIHELNKEHRNIDRSTDVLSFPLGELILCGVFNVALNACPNKRGRKGATLKNRYLCNLLIVFLRELFGDM